LFAKLIVKTVINKQTSQVLHKYRAEYNKELRSWIVFAEPDKFREELLKADPNAIIAIREFIQNPNQENNNTSNMANNINMNNTNNTNQIFVDSHIPSQSYLVHILKLFANGIREIRIIARGKAIANAVAVTAMIREKLPDNTNIEEVEMSMKEYNKHKIPEIIIKVSKK